MRPAIQLYTLREQLDYDFRGTINRLSKLECPFVETAGLHGLDAQDFRSCLDDTGLVAKSSHVSLEDLETRQALTVSQARVLGVKWLVVPWVGPEIIDEGWDKLAHRLNKLSVDLLRQGLKLAYHNHDFEFRATAGTTGFETLSNTAEETVELELDLYWCHVAAHDPVEVLQQLAGRVPLTHFKDGTNGTFMPVGQGSLDWAPIVQAAKTVGVEYAIVELDESPYDPVDCVAQSLDHLQSLGAFASN